MQDMGRNRPFSGRRSCWERCFASDWCSLHGHSRKRRMPFAFRWKPHSGAFRTDTAGGRTPFTGKWAFHKGIDLACAEGTGILAVQGGTVLRTKRSASYGSCIELLLADGTAAVYAHLQYIYVRPGEAVEAGQTLGTAGQSGRATGAHLHFELYRQGKACDPADALGLSHEAS